MKFFVSSDIHSAYTPWMTALAEMGFDKNNPDHMIIVCGDLFDRMSETREVFAFVKEMVEANKLIYIRGNHEDLLAACINKEIANGKFPGRHHFSNGTIKTICQFCNESEWIIYDPTWTSKICDTVRPILDFIETNAVDYYETKNYMFVHSQIPAREWTEEAWSDARWGNPFISAQAGLLPENKTLVFGHFHTSWARANFDGKPEWYDDADFSPYYGEGYIGIDACTAYTGKCNVLVIEDDQI